ncbi:MAG: hypothetical protein AUG51_09400 [Acidobacteria bacterium 13_1_20CM_3_53_8]|nr:MAG: hypothetical protein AUG51_09400 [Acidobacteria bacterium 13_1_20CM_3_53_8]
MEVDRIEINVNMATYGFQGERIDLTLMVPKGRIDNRKFLKHLKQKIVAEVQSTLEYGLGEADKQ